jgi:hypothetical protein
MAGDELGDASQQEFAQAFFSVRAEDDQIRSPFSGYFEDSRAYLILHDTRIHLESRVAEGIRGARNDVPGLLQLILESFSHLRGVACGHLRGSGVHERFHDAQDEHFSVLGAEL